MRRFSALKWRTTSLFVQTLSGDMVLQKERRRWRQLRHVGTAKRRVRINTGPLSAVLKRRKISMEVDVFRAASIHFHLRLSLWLRLPDRRNLIFVVSLRWSVHMIAKRSARGYSDGSTIRKPRSESKCLLICSEGSSWRSEIQWIFQSHVSTMEI